MRGQTTLDFGIGAGVFLLGVVFLLTFAPSTLLPFVDGTQEHPVVSDRAADRLANDELAAPDRPSTLDTATTIAFFEAGNPAGRVGVDGDRYDIEVELRAGGDRLCWDDNAREVTTTNCNVEFVAGDDPAGADAVTLSRRGVTVGARQAQLVVRVW
ncbi:DUF7287 family protein [Natronomonas sp.]|uniref:DUF7287 family protein n=1 Tax=Natronomonas sp. TaxID=2184060 RepID=UPI002FC2FAAC